MTPRYDVTILVNGLPLVHVELKRRGVAIKEAFNQTTAISVIASGLVVGFMSMCRFLLSPTAHSQSIIPTPPEQATSRKVKIPPRSTARKLPTASSSLPIGQTATTKSFPTLVDFTKTFFAKHTILNILTKYCVFTSEELLLVMRPYQIVATERILNRIEVSTNYKKTGTIEARRIYLAYHRKRQDLDFL